MEIEPQYIPCSLHQIKLKVNPLIKNNTEHVEDLAKFWSVVKQKLVERRLAIESVDDLNASKRKQQILKMKQLRTTASNNRKKIDEMLMKIASRVKSSKEIELRVGTDEITPQEIGMLEESVEMVREINFMTTSALQEIEKIANCSLLPRKSTTAMETIC
ncbi:Uncharacterized protein QTN25_010112 [Entamoeba marina]